MVNIDALPTDEGMENKTAVLMLSCNKFRSSWGPFFEMLSKFWPDCPYRIILGTDTGSFPGIETVQVGRDKQWASNCIDILDKVDVQKVILFLEDYFLLQPVNNDRIRRCVRHAYDHDIGCLRLFPCPGPTAPWSHTESLGILQKKDNYRLSLQVALWDKKMLKSLLVRGEDAWQTEERGTRRAAMNNGRFVSVLRGEAPVQYEIGIRKGVWQRKALELLSKNGIDISNLHNIK